MHAWFIVYSIYYIWCVDLSGLVIYSLGMNVCLYTSQLSDTHARTHTRVTATAHQTVSCIFYYSVWYGTTIRGDVNKVTIGERTSVMDRAVVHVAKIQGDAPTFIGNNVTVGAGATIHAATLKDLCIVGESAQILDGAVVESNSIVEAGAIVTSGTVVPTGELWAGAPAKKVRALTPEEIAEIPQRARDTLQLANLHAIETSKDYKTVKEEEEWIEFLDGTEVDDPHRQGPPPNIDDIQGMGTPGRIFNSTLTRPEEGLKKKSQ